jgi:hypothetical protein
MAERAEKTSDIQFFGEVDRNRHGNISSAIPAWMLNQHIDELKESIGRKERALARNEIEPGHREYARQELETEKAKLKGIMESRPNLTGKQKDELIKVRAEIAEQIKNTMPTLRDSREGFVRPYDEFRRLKEPSFKVDPALAKSLGVKVTNGKVTGDGLNRMYGIISAAVGEDGSIERLRRDRGQGSYRTMDHDTREALEKMSGR